MSGCIIIAQSCDRNFVLNYTWAKGDHSQGSFCVCTQPMRRRYIVTWSLFSWVHTQNDPCKALDHWEYTNDMKWKLPYTYKAFTQEAPGKSESLWLMMAQIYDSICMDHSVCVSSRWEIVLHCNAVSHWLHTYTEWPLDMVPPVRSDSMSCLVFPNIFFKLCATHKRWTTISVLEVILPHHM